MPPRHATATAAVTLALNVAGAAPDWIMLMPAGLVQTVDGRGPYKLTDSPAVIAASLKAGDRLPIDENHATDLATRTGGQAPARGWIVALEAREGAIWGRVEWTRAGAELLTDGAYRHISPVFIHRKDGTVRQLLRAALTNNPNLRELVALNTEGADMDFMAKLREALGLAEDADEDKALAAVNTLKGGSETALQSALQPIAKAAGLKEDADANAVLGAVETLAAKAKTGGGDNDTVKALQTELAGVTEQLNTLTSGVATEKAEAFVDGAIRDQRVGVKALRDHYIARHVKEPAAVEKEIAALPKLGPSGAHIDPPKDKDGNRGLDANETAIVAMMGLDPAKFKETRAAEAAEEVSL